MAKFSGLQRRGAIYHWRRRLPPRRGAADRRTHLAISLRTPVLARARRLAAELNVLAERHAEQLAMMTPEQIQIVFRQALLQHIAKLEAILAGEKSDPAFEVEASIREDMRWYWTYRWLAARGCAAEIDDAAAAAMRTKGLSEEDILQVALRLQVLRRQKMVPTAVGKLEPLLADAGADPTEVNIAVAQQSYFRAMSQAFELSARTQREGPLADDVAAEAIVRAAARQAALAGAATAPPPAPPLAEAAEPQADRGSTSDDIVILGEALIAQEANDGNWDDKLQRQNRQTYALFARFLREERRVRGLTGLKQTDLAAFADFLRHEIYRHYGKSEKDGDLSIAQLRQQASDKEKAARDLAAAPQHGKARPLVSAGADRRQAEEDARVVGLEGTTLNRHLTGLAKLIAYAGDRVPIAPDLAVSKLRAKLGRKRRRKRDQRLKLPLAASLKVFRYAPFTGCKTWERPYTPGPLVWHRGLYFAPMILEYAGCRLEEAAGLAVDDIILGPIPYFHIRDNRFRRIKNPSSDRLIPIHPELIRLGFLEYVARIKALGYLCVFPDLCPPGSKGQAGARLYKEFRRLLTWACEACALSTDHDLHSIRHGFDTRLKDAGVPEEFRQDLMGHEGGSETSARYAEAVSLERGLEALAKLPILTAHLQPQPLRLLPWVEQKQTRPSSRAARRRPRAKV